MSFAAPEPIAAAAERLRAGGVVAFPTETVYGLGADAFNESAVRRVFELKGRPANNPLIVHVADEAMARSVAAEWPARAAALAAKFWPGPLTLVLPKAARVPPIVTGGGDTVAVRCPDHPVALALIRAAGTPIVGPSANPSGRLSPTTAAHVRAAFGANDVMVLDGGPCARGIESTVVSLAGADADSPRVLRPGVITAVELDAAGGWTAPLAGAPRVEDGASVPLPSPGMMASHYAPRTPAILFDPSDWPRIEARAAREPRGVVVLSISSGHHMPPPSRMIAMPRDAAAYAARLYAALHEADALGAGLIAIERPTPPPPSAAGSAHAGPWDAILDRLVRATHG